MNILNNLKYLPWGFGIVVLGCLSSCSTARYKPCTDGGQPARENPAPFHGTKRCDQTVTEDGTVFNHGKYLEWFANDKIAITGEYKMGKKTGRWIEYDEKGNKVSDKYFQEGKEVQRP